MFFHFPGPDNQKNDDNKITKKRVTRFCQAAGDFSCGIFGDVSIFSTILGEICHIGSFSPIKPHMKFLVYLLATNMLSVCRPLKMLKHEGSTVFRRSVVQKLEEECFQ